MLPVAPTQDLGPLLLAALPVGLVAGLHAATWGAYKDAPYEGYHPQRQVRTVVVATLAAVVGVVAGVLDPRVFIPAIGVVYALERLATEWWKSIVRRDDQSRYAIPMRLGFRGRPVDVGWLRYAVGALALAALGGLAAVVHAAQPTLAGLPWWVVVPTVGGLGGWLTALGGAWKDAPIEGFSGWKFLRSPAVAAGWAAPLSLMSGGWVTVSLAAAGLAVFTIETYKTFGTGGRAPGKFAGMPLRDPLPATRRLMGVLHACTWVVFAVAGLDWSPWLQLPASPVTAAAAATGVVAGLALVAAGAVLRANSRVAVGLEVRAREHR